MKKLLLTICFTLFAMAQLPAAWAGDGFIDNKQCGTCHKSQKRDFQASAHGMAFEGEKSVGCQSCHGGGAAHYEVAGEDDYKGPMKIEAFKKTGSAADDKNNLCLTCHKKDANRSHWEGSTHQSRDVTCVSCHKIHTDRDSVLDKRTQPDVCFTCHKEQRTQISKPSHHPIPEGKMGCSDCHNLHGSAGPKLMKRDSVNATCYTCHMEKRGPFVFNHQPVSEDCTICHNPHGTVTESLLKSRPPFLCQQCHNQHTAISPALSPPAPANFNPSHVTVTQGRGCVNCHNQIHGSNNPQDTNPQRLLR